MKKQAIIVGGGQGIRMGGGMPKQFQLLKGKPLIWHSIKAFTDAFPEIQIILILPAEHLEKGKDLIGDFPSHTIQLLQGGETRYQSVKNGLQLIENDALVFVHDAVRCLVTAGLIKRCAETAIEKGNAVPAIAASDSLRIQTSSGNEQIDRNKIRIIQTPQVFPGTVLKKAFDQDYEESFTDEATVVERTGIKIHLLEGEKTNIKITNPIDLIIAENLLSTLY